MTSADFSSCSTYRSRPPQVRAYSFPQYPLDLPDRYLMVSHPWDVSMMCYLIRPVRPQYPVPVRWNRGLQSRFLHSMLHSNRACDLLMLRDTTPAHKGLSPSGIIWYLRYQMPMLDAHNMYEIIATQDQHTSQSYDSYIKRCEAYISVSF